MSNENLNDLLKKLRLSISGGAYLGDNAELDLCEAVADGVEQLQKENERLKKGLDRAECELEAGQSVILKL